MLEGFLRERPEGMAEEMREVGGRYHWRDLAPRLDTILEGIT